MIELIAFLKERSLRRSKFLSPEKKEEKGHDAPSALSSFKEGLIPVIFVANEARVVLENPGTIVLFIRSGAAIFRARQYETETRETYVSIAYDEGAYLIRDFPQGAELRIDAYDTGRKRTIASLVSIAKSFALAGFAASFTQRSDVVIDSAFDDARVWMPSKKTFGVSPLLSTLQDGTPLRKVLKGGRGYCLVGKADEVLSYALRLENDEEPIRLDAFFPPTDDVLGTLSAETKDGLPKGLLIARERSRISEEEGKLKQMELMLRSGDVWKELA